MSAPGAPAGQDGYVVHEGCDHIFFVGFLGAGKSTLARNLGRLFRRDEAAALETLRDRKSLLVSCGGGIVESPACCKAMHEMGVVVYLDGDLDDSLRQIQHPEKRPDLGTPEHARELYLHRRPLYRQTADYVVDIRDKDFEEVAGDAARLLWEEGLL